MNLFEKLMLAKQMSFSDGSIKMFDIRMILVAGDFFAEYAKMIDQSPVAISQFYNSAKSSFKEGFAKKIGISYSFSFNDFFKWLTDIANLAGYGSFTWQDLNEDNKSGVILVENSAISSSLKGKVMGPADHAIRGFIAGGASASLKEDIDVLEEECIALGAPRCRFVFKRASDFNKSPEVLRQLAKPNV